MVQVLIRKPGLLIPKFLQSKQKGPTFISEKYKHLHQRHKII